jgi:hypothetical protein
MKYNKNIMLILLNLNLKFKENINKINFITKNLQKYNKKSLNNKTKIYLNSKTKRIINSLFLTSINQKALLIYK